MNDNKVETDTLGLDLIYNRKERVKILKLENNNEN